jgi:hypothetical protein
MSPRDHDPYTPAEALAQALEQAAELRDRCAAAEQEVYQLKIALEDAHGSVNRLSMKLAEEREENARLRALLGKRSAS